MAEAKVVPGCEGVESEQPGFGEAEEGDGRSGPHRRGTR